MFMHNITRDTVHFELLKTKTKQFEILPFNPYITRQDILCIHEHMNGYETGNICMKQITCIEVINEQLMVVSLQDVPNSYMRYTQLSNREKQIMDSLLTHKQLYGLHNRDIANTFHDLFTILLGEAYEQAPDDDLEWYTQRMRDLDDEDEDEDA